MQPSRFNDILTRHGMTTNDAALIAGVTRRQVNNWRNGYSPIPRSFAMIMEFFDSGIIALDAIEKYVNEDLRTLVD